MPRDEVREWRREAVREAAGAGAAAPGGCTGSSERKVERGRRLALRLGVGRCVANEIALGVKLKLVRVLARGLGAETVVLHILLGRNVRVERVRRVVPRVGDRLLPWLWVVEHILALLDCPAQLLDADERLLELAALVDDGILD